MTFTRNGDRHVNKIFCVMLVVGFVVAAIALSDGADEHDHEHDATTRPLVTPTTRDEHEHGNHAKGEKSGGDKDEDGHERGHKHAEGGHADEVRLTAEAVRRHDIRIAPVAKQP